MKGQRPNQMIEARAITWPDAVDPDGQVWHIHNLNAFCEEHGLDVSMMRKAVLGKVRSYRGWRKLDGDPIPFNTTLLNTHGKQYRVTDPNGMVYEPIYNLTAFARDHGLDASALYKVVNGRIRFYRGWNVIEL